MSAEATAWAWAHSLYKHSDPRLFVIHLAVAEVVNKPHGNEFWMAAANLAEEAGTSRQYACEALRRMVTDGLLEVVEASMVGGKPTGRPARYRFLTPGGVHAEDAPRVHAEDAPGCTLTMHPVHADSARNLKEPEGELKGRRERRRRPEVPIPNPFDLSEELWDWAERECPLVDVEAETQNFVDWMRAKDVRYRNWYAAWKLWLRKTQRRLAAGPQRKPA